MQPLIHTFLPLFVSKASYPHSLRPCSVRLHTDQVNRLHHTAAFSRPVSRFIIQMLAGETVRAMVPMIVPCACRYNGFAADLTDEGLIGCPKLDDVDYSEKLTEIIANNDIRAVTIVRMEVPCCGGLQRAAETALKNSGKFIPWQVVTISRDGRIID